MQWRSALFLGILVSLGFAAGAAWAESGDVNGNGRIDDEDFHLIDQYLDGSIILQENQIRAADTDHDGKITRKDRELLARRFAKLGVKAAPKVKSEASAIQLQSSDSGVVVDKVTGKPLAGVEVSLPDENITVRTDSQGRFRLPRYTPGKILTVRASTYVPKSITLSRSGSLADLKLEQLNAQLTVVDDNAYHLGDGNFDATSANGTQIKKPTIGGRYEKTFELESYPSQDLTLRIGSLIGVDTRESVAAGQSGLTDRNLAEKGGLRIFLNGSSVARLVLNGDDLTVALPRWLLQKGSNTLVFSMDPFDQVGISLAATPATFYYPGMDLDDIEFAHVIIEDPTGSLVHGQQEQNMAKKLSK
jgi:hypothetical protein